MKENFCKHLPTSIQYITNGVVCLYKILSRATLFILTVLFTMFVIDIIAVTVFLRVPLFTRLYYSQGNPTPHIYKGFGYAIDIPKSEGSNKIIDYKECGYVYIIEILGKEVYTHSKGMH